MLTRYSQSFISSHTTRKKTIAYAGRANQATICKHQSQTNTIQSSNSYSLSLFPLATLHHPHSSSIAVPLYAAGHAAALPIARFLPAIIVIAFPFCTATATAPLNSCDTTSCGHSVLWSRLARMIWSNSLADSGPIPPVDSMTNGMNFASCCSAVDLYLLVLILSPNMATANGWVAALDTCVGQSGWLIRTLLLVNLRNLSGCYTVKSQTTK